MTYNIIFALILIMGELKGQLFVINQKPHEFKCQLGRLKSWSQAFWRELLIFWVAFLKLVKKADRFGGAGITQGAALYWITYSCREYPFINIVWTLAGLELSWAKYFRIWFWGGKKHLLKVTQFALFSFTLQLSVWLDQQFRGWFQELQNEILRPELNRRLG